LSDTPTPKNLDLDKDRGLSVTWADGAQSFYPIEYLRRMSPSAEMKQFRDEQKENPLSVIPEKMTRHEGPLVALSAEMIGNYAIRIRFSDGHDTGIYSWTYLRQIDPSKQERD
jgi:DUF971 family protein